MSVLARRPYAYALLGAFVFLVCESALADTIVLAGGQRVTARVINVSEASVIARVNGTESVFPRSSVTSVEFASTSSANTSASRADAARQIAANQTTRLRISSWNLPEKNDPNSYGVFYQLLNDLRIGGSERLAAGTVVYGVIRTQTGSNGNIQFVKTLETGFDPQRLVRLSHRAVSGLKVIKSASVALAPVNYSAGDPAPQAGTTPEEVEALNWLKVGNVVEWTFLSN